MHYGFVQVVSIYVNIYIYPSLITWYIVYVILILLVGITYHVYFRVLFPVGCQLIVFKFHSQFVILSSFPWSSDVECDE